MARFVRLNQFGIAEDYVQRRTEKHGCLYKVTREGPLGILECKSVASGATITLMDIYVEDLPDALCEQAPPVP